jgi:hypothetical protein
MTAHWQGWIWIGGLSLMTAGAILLAVSVPLVG